MLKWSIVIYPILLLNKWKLFHPVGELKQAESSIATLFAICVCKEDTAIWWEGWDPHWRTVPGVHTCCWLQRPFLWEFLLTPNTLRLKEKKCDLDVNHSKLSSWADCGELLLLLGTGVCDVCKYKFAARADQKKTHILYFSHAERRLSSKSNCALTSWCSAPSFSLSVVFLKPCYA